MRAMWAHRHALLATGDDNITLSGHDLLCCEGDGTQTGPADLIDTECGLGIWNSGYARGLTGGILTRSGRQYLAEDMTSSISSGAKLARWMAALIATSPKI